MGINFQPKSLLAFVFAVSLVAYLAGKALGLPQLSSAAQPFLVISSIIWLIFVGLSVARNIRAG